MKVLQGFLLIPLNVFLVSFNSFPLVAAGVYFSFSNVNEKLPLSKQGDTQSKTYYCVLETFPFQIFCIHGILRKFKCNGISRLEWNLKKTGSSWFPHMRWNIVISSASEWKTWLKSLCSISTLALFKNDFLGDDCESTQNINPPHRRGK